MSNNRSNSSGCITPICIITLVVFIILRCINVITWSWWIVLIPLWIIIALNAIVLATALILNAYIAKESEKSIFDSIVTDSNKLTPGLLSNQRDDQELRDFEDSFKLDVNNDDIKKDKDCRKISKWLKKERKNFDKRNK